MARRRDKGLFDLLALAPWWVSVALAIAIYVAGRLAPQFLRFESPVLAGANVLVGHVSKHAHFLALPFLLVAALAVLASNRRRKLLDQQTDIESIRNLNWKEFELLVGEAFRRQGYEVEENGGGWRRWWCGSSAAPIR